VSLSARVYMPYRAMLYTLLAVALGLLTSGMWLRAVRPMVMRSDDAEKVSPPVGEAWKAVETAHEEAHVIAHPARALRKFINGVSLLNLLLISSLLVVGFFATFREWVRVAALSGPRPRRQRTRYVDAWKLAGERARPATLPEEPGDSAA
jgi:hypothetical protein